MSNQCPCPYCGKQVSSDLWEFAEGCHETECGHCEKPIILTVDVSVDYTARPIQREPEPEVK